MIPQHLAEGNYSKNFPPALDEFPTVINEQHYIDAWLLNSPFNSILALEQYLIDHRENIEAAIGGDVVGADGESLISIPKAYYPPYRSCLAWDSNLLAENIIDGVKIFDVEGNFMSKAFSVVSVFPVAPAVATASIRAGNQNIIGANLSSGSMVNAALVNVADIVNPSAWTNICDLAAGPYMIGLLPYGTETFLMIISSDENGGSSFRIQMLLDEIIVLDIQMTRGATSPTQSVYTAMGPGNSTNYPWLYVEATFKIRACRHNTLLAAETRLMYPSVVYASLTP